MTTPNMEVQKKWTSVFYWTDYPLISTLELFNAGYLHYTETTGRFTGKPKLVGYVQFKVVSSPGKRERKWLLFASCLNATFPPFCRCTNFQHSHKVNYDY